MLKALEDISSTKKRLKIEIPAEAIESEIIKRIKEAQKNAKIPGFRPGRAPIHIIEKKFGKDIEAEVLERVISEHYLNAIKEADIKPVSGPVVEKFFDFKRKEPISMTISVEVRPKIESLNYENIVVKDINVEVNDEEVDAVLERLAEEKATYEPVDDAIREGDLVTIDYIAEGNASRDVVLKVGSGNYPQEFFDGIIGRKKDEKFALEATFPEDSHLPFAGKRIKFEVEIKDIKRRNIAAIDDEFAKDMGLENIGQLKDKIKENILASKNIDAESTKQAEIFNKLVESHSFDIPEVMLNAEIKGILGEIRAAGNDKRTDEEIMKDIMPLAEKRIRGSIILELIGEKEGIRVSDEDVKEEILRIARKYYIHPDIVIKYYMARDGSLKGVERSVFEKKVLNFILSKAKIEKGE